MTLYEIGSNDLKEFLLFLKSKYNLIHNSNFFFRDLHYGAMEFLAARGNKTGYTAAEGVARRAAEKFEQQGIFKRIDHQSWCILYPEFALPRVEKAKPAAPAKS